MRKLEFHQIPIQVFKNVDLHKERHIYLNKITSCKLKITSRSVLLLRFVNQDIFWLSKVHKNGCSYAFRIGEQARKKAIERRIKSTDIELLQQTYMLRQRNVALNICELLRAKAAERLASEALRGLFIASYDWFTTVRWIKPLIRS